MILIDDGDDVQSTVNGMTESLSVFADEVTRVAREVGTEGRLGGQAKVRFSLSIQMRQSNVDVMCR